MGTITARRRKDGSIGYTAQIRVHRDGKLVHSESETFDRRALAEEWKRRREAALDAQRARGEPLGKRMTVAEMVEWYEDRERAEDPWGRTKRADLQRIRKSTLADKRVDRLTRQDFIGYVEERRTGGAGPATAGNDLVWLRQVLRTATAVLGAPTPIHALDEAANFLRGEKLIGKSRSRDRRVTPSEEAKLLEYLDGRRGMPAGDIMRFALASARRQEEITRLKWADLDRDKGIAWLDDVKHPTRKKGNRKSFRLLSDAWAVIERQPRINKADMEERIFPFESKSISAAFTRAAHFLGIADLHFHDLRHEATSRLFERGYSIQEVAQFTLHESWATLKRYTHLRPQDVPERNPTGTSLVGN